MTERDDLRKVIAHLESQRVLLGDEAVDAALEPLNDKLAELESDLHDTLPKLISERRVVTVLFCDVSGSTALAEKLDPEEWTNIMNVAFEHFIEPVERYGGTVTRLMGDAILALFGAPTAHEDDAERAVLAGLAILDGIRPFREALRRDRGLDFNARVGINTGLVVVGKVGSDGRGEYTAMGDAVNVAARMESTAAPGTVQIAEGTFNLVSHMVETEDLGPIAVKGKAEPTKAYRVLGRRAQAQRARGLRGVRTPLIGRDEEKRSLLAALDHTMSGNGQIACIIGEVGLGKTRLIKELHNVWRNMMAAARTIGAPEASDGQNWFAAASLSYESVRPYGLFQGFIRQALGADQGDPPEMLRGKIALFAQTLPEERQATAPQALETLFGLQDGSDDTAGGQPRLDGEAFKNVLFDIVLNMVRNWMAGRPSVLIYDDVHWSDPASVELLVHLFQLTETLPLLLICAFRPEQNAPCWQLKVRAEGDQRGRYTEIELQPLSNDDCAELIRHLLRMENLPPDLHDRILIKVGGNPLFVEEVVRTLIQSGIVVPKDDDEGWTVTPNFNAQQIEVPDTLQSLLTARIDRLDGELRRTLQLAALIGRTFHYKVLEAMMTSTSRTGQEPADDVPSPLDTYLERLQELDLIRPVPQAPETEYIFRHTMVQESAYRSTLRGQRRLLHRRVGEAMEKIFAQRLEDFSQLLAQHFSKAGDHERTKKYSILAGDAAFRLYANEEAAGHYKRAITATQQLETSSKELIYIYAQWGRALELSSKHIEALLAFDDMLHHAEERSDEPMKLAALINILILRSFPNPVFDEKEGEAVAEQALILAKKLGDEAAQSRILWGMLNLYRFLGHVEMAKGFGENSLAIARRLDLREQMAYTLNDLTHVYSRIGQYRQAKVSVREANTLWREIGNQPMLADNLSISSYVHVYTGDYDWGDAFAKEAYQISQSVNNIWGMSFSRWAVGKLYWDRGYLGNAIELQKEGNQLGEQAGFMAAQIFSQADLGLDYGLLGLTEVGLKTAQRAVDVALISFEQALPYAWARLAQVQLLKGNIDAAVEAVEKLQSSNQPRHVAQPDLVFIAECFVALARGDNHAAQELVDERVQSLRRYEMTAYLPEALYAKAQVHVALGQPDQAMARLGEASTIAGRMNARWYQWQILGLAAEIETQRGNAMKADRLRVKAVENIDYIAGRAGSVELRNAFLALPGVKKTLATQPSS